MTIGYALKIAAIPVCLFAALLLFVRVENKGISRVWRYRLALLFGVLFIVISPCGHYLASTSRYFWWSFGDKFFSATSGVLAMGMGIASFRNRPTIQGNGWKWLVAGGLITLLWSLIGVPSKGL